MFKRRMVCRRMVTFSPYAQDTLWSIFICIIKNFKLKNITFYQLYIASKNNRLVGSTFCISIIDYIDFPTQNRRKKQCKLFSVLLYPLEILICVVDQLGFLTSCLFQMGIDGMPILKNKYALFSIF